MIVVSGRLHFNGHFAPIVRRHRWRFFRLDVTAYVLIESSLKPWATGKSTATSCAAEELAPPSVNKCLRNSPPVSVD